MAEDMINRQYVSQLQRVFTAASAVNLDKSGRSGGSVYMVHREQMLALQTALREVGPSLVVVGDGD